jgi:phosphoribosylaminoimidazole-succinocarboxamide synthase
VSGYRVGVSPPSFDKQFVRDWLETQPWNKKAPAPHLPPDVLKKTTEKYKEALRLLTQ